MSLIMRSELCFFLVLNLHLLWCSLGVSPTAPFTTYKHSLELLPGTAHLWWTVNDAQTEITFELHVKTTGWIGLGISPAGGMVGADIGTGWVDQNGQLHFQDRYAQKNAKPIIDTTSTDWFGLQGKAEDGWTVIQFRRLLDTCDTMDVPIRSGANILIFAYGPLNRDGDITYHQDRRTSRIVSLRSYADPPSDEDFRGLESFEFLMNQYRIPPTDTTYYCQVFKGPSRYFTKRHVIAYKTIIASINRDLVHHFTTYQCDSDIRFDDAHLPNGICDEIMDELKSCKTDVVAAWAIGGDDMTEFPKEAGYAIGEDSRVRYFMIQMHYDNPKGSSNRTDSSGIRFYVNDRLRQYDLGYLQFGTESNAAALAIPPGVDQFIVDSYCSPKASQNLPRSGITVVSALPHTHLQGQSVWTKLIRNGTAVQYLFNADSYDFNYQFQYRLPEPVQLYPGDAFSTRCVFNTAKKTEITLGGERTTEEMCSQTFIYYPRIFDVIACVSSNQMSAWQTLTTTNSFDSSPLTNNQLKDWLLTLPWTPALAKRWQKFYDDSSRLVSIVGRDRVEQETFDRLPIFNDLISDRCNRANHFSIVVTPTVLLLINKL